MTDPKAAVDAVMDMLSNPRPFTLARWAALMKVKSFLVEKQQDSQSDEIDIIPTLYVMFADSEDLRGSMDDIKSAAWKWADGIEPSKMQTMLDKSVKAVRDAMYMLQESSQSGKKKSNPQTESSQGF